MRSKIEEILGWNGRMVGGSKSMYRNAHPNNAPIFNANVVAENPDGSYEKVWYGDLDLTVDFVKLKGAAEALGVKLYVLWEMDARFENESEPKIERFVVNSDGEFSEESANYYELDGDSVVSK